MLPHITQTKVTRLDEDHLLNVPREVLYGTVGRGERLRRQLVGCWELLLIAEVLLVTLLAYNRPVQTSVLLAECLQGLSSRLLHYAALTSQIGDHNWSETHSSYWVTRQLV